LVYAQEIYDDILYCRVEETQPAPYPKKEKQTKIKLSKLPGHIYKRVVCVQLLVFPPMSQQRKKERKKIEKPSESNNITYTVNST